MMEIEIGAKVDYNKIEKKLVLLGAELRGEEKQVDTLCKLSHRKLGRHEVIRLRETESKAEITYKEPVPEEMQGVISRQEISFQTTAEEGKIFLEALGAKPLIAVDKARKVYQLKDFKIGLDRVKGLGDFIEIELMGSNKEIARKRIFSLMKKLGINENSLMEKPYFLMLLEKI